MLFMQEMLWGSGGGPATISYRTSSTDAVDRTTYTFASLDIGTASPTRKVIVGITTGATADRTISSVTVAGIAASLVDTISDFNGIGTYYRAALYIAEVPTGTTGNVVVTMSGATSACGVGIWAADGLASATATTTTTDTDDPFSLNINTTAGGIVVAIVNNSPVTWTGLTENFDVNPAADLWHTGASAAITTASTPLTITADGPAGAGGGVAAAWSAAA
jgi:hypothetical protein